MPYSVVVLRGGDLEDRTVMVRCNLSDAAASVQVDWCRNNGRPSGWESTQYQCTDASHRWGELAELGKVLAADGGPVPHEEFECDALDEDDLNFDDRCRLGLVEPEIVAIVDVLARFGDKFTANDPEFTARRWARFGCAATEVAEWCEIGCWDLSALSAWRSAGLTPAQVKAAAKKLVADLDDPSEKYTNGCPIYSCCNHDTSTDVIVDAAIPSPRARPMAWVTASDRLRLYDLRPLAYLWCVAGPDNLDPRYIDPANLPEGCRWISDAEWQDAVAD